MVYHVGSDKKYLIILVVTRNVGNGISRSCPTIKKVIFLDQFLSVRNCPELALRTAS